MSTNNEFLLSASNFSIPKAINDSPGLTFGGKKVRSILLSTDLAYLQNLDTDALMVLHPFEPSEELNHIILGFTKKPVLCNIGGGFRDRYRASAIAKAAEKSGAEGVVITKPTSHEVVQKLRKNIDTKLIYTVIYPEENISSLVDAGVDIFNVSTGEDTALTVGKIRKSFSDVPLMASGGPFESTIFETIKMGADAIVYNPPTATEILRTIFDDFRREKRFGKS